MKGDGVGEVLVMVKYIYSLTVQDRPGLLRHHAVVEVYLLADQGMKPAGFNLRLGFLL